MHSPWAEQPLLFDWLLSQRFKLPPLWPLFVAEVPRETWDQVHVLERRPTLSALARVVAA